MAFSSNIGREITKDIEDVTGDRKINSKTIPIVFGYKISKIVAILFILLAVIITPVPYLLGLLNAYYIKIVAASVAAFLYSCFVLMKDVSKAQKIMKIAMFIGILAFLVGAI